jgi:vanillate O-demethylase ferredoxin subunit
VSVAAEQTIAGALLDAGIAVELSCEQGMCGACFTPLLEGEAEHRDTVQNEDEKARHVQIALCCSRAKTPRLVLDL